MSRKTIGRYEIQSEIGRGGMAVVYLAYDPNFRRNVAIKLVSVNLNENHIFKERFEREAHLIAKIEHPAIVPVYDFGEEDNQPYLVMRHMSGGSLAKKIKAGPLSLEYVTQLISKIAPALDAVHAEGVVHRDLKPANILLDGFGNPAISDFGIAHLTASTIDLTGSSIIGTPSYMSPEQVSGQDLDGRSDVYSLGIIFFEMLIGRSPFTAPTPMSVALKHLTEPIPSIYSFRPDLPLEADSILDKAMAKDKEVRYANASEMATDLQSINYTVPENVVPTSKRILPTNGMQTEVDVSEGSLSVPKIIKETNNPVSIQQTDHPKKSSSGFLRIAALAGVGLILFFVCSSLGLFGTWAGLTGIFSRQPTVAVTSTTSAQNIVLYADDFSDPLSGWPTIQNDQGGYSYESDGYHISVYEVNSAPYAKTNRQDDNASIYVDARPAMADVSGYYGLLCRIQDNQNFYYFVIQSNGEYAIGKKINGEFQSFFAERMESNAIKRDGQTNRLRADCVGNVLRFYVNDALVADVTDSDFSSGYSGIVALALETQGFEVIFNNFLITAAKQ